MWKAVAEWVASWFRPSQRADFEALVALQRQQYEDLRKEFAEYRTRTDGRIRELEERLDTAREQADDERRDCAGKIAALRIQVADLRAQVGQSKRRPGESPAP